MRGVMSDIFISYATKDGSPEANELAAALEAAGRRCWIAPRDMKPGVEFPAQIVKAIRDCGGFVLVLTPGANVSRDVLQEVTTAHNGDKLIVPLIVRSTPPSDGLHYFLVARQQIAWTQAKAIAAALVEVFTSTGGTASAQRQAKTEGDTAHERIAEERPNLGRTLLDADGVPYSDTEALKRLRLAANQGFAQGQYGVGFMYYTGRDGVRSDTEAAKWYRLSADQGFALAQNNLGDLYRKGRGVTQSDIEAVKWYRLSADQGSSVAQNNLGNMYREGLGVPQSDTEAAKWYRLSADQGFALAQTNLGNMYLEGLGVPHSDIEAVKWYGLAADQGFAAAQSCLGFMYETGRGVQKSDSEAAMWYHLAAKQGDRYAEERLIELGESSP
jgi:TPR repeat protein